MFLLVQCPLGMCFVQCYLYCWWNSTTASIPFLKISSEKFSFGEWMASLSSPNPIRMVLIPRICSKSLMIGILPPRRTASGFFPKATVQAAIGSVPMAMGLSCGQIVLSVAVLGILITAPLGAIGMDCSYKKLLSREIDKSQIFSS